MMMAKLGQNPKFQFLYSIANQIGQAQMTALTGKNDITSAQVSLNLTKLSSTLQSQAAQANSQGLKTDTSNTAPSANATQKLKESSAETHNLGSADPDADSNSGYGSAEPSGDGANASSGSGYSDYTNSSQSSSGSSTSGSDPSTWNTQNMRNDVLPYDRMMFHYFDMLQSSQMNNPQDIIAFVTALSKLAEVQNATLPSGKSYESHFQAFLSSLNNINVEINGHSTTFGPALAFALAVAAIYNQNQTGEDAQTFLNQIAGQLGSTPGFLGQMASELQNGSALASAKSNQIYQEMQNNTDGGKQLVSNVVEDIGYSIQESFGDIRESYMSTYESSVEQELDKLGQSGASIYEMMNIVLMSYDMSDDYAASYAIPINDLGNAGNAGATMMQFLTPTGMTTGQTREGSPYYIANGNLSPAQSDQDKQFMQAFNAMNNEWANTPSLQQSGVAASVQGAYSKIAQINLPTTSWLNGKPSLRAAFSQGGLSRLQTLFEQTPSGKASGGESVNIGDLSTLMKNNPGDKDLLNKYLTAGLDFINSTQVDSKTNVPSPNSQTQAAINSIQTLQSQISSVNQSAKAEFTNANQSAANLLSTVGGIEKNIVGMLNNIVQAQKF